MFDDDLANYRAKSDDELLELTKHNDSKAVAILLERLVKGKC